MSKISTVPELSPLLEKYADQLENLLLAFEIDFQTDTLHMIFADMYSNAIRLKRIRSPQPLNWSTARLDGPFLMQVEYASKAGSFSIPTNELRMLADTNMATLEHQYIADSRQQLQSKLQSLRKDQGFTQEQLAEAAGIKRVTLNRIENGNQAAKLETLEKLAGALGVDVVDLLIGD